MNKAGGKAEFCEKGIKILKYRFAGAWRRNSHICSGHVRVLFWTCYSVIEIIQPQGLSLVLKIDFRLNHTKLYSIQKIINDCV